MAPKCLLVFTTLALAACGGSSTDQTTGFLGTWTFSSGKLTPNCIAITASPFDLTGLSVVFAKVDDSTISLTAGTAGCTVEFGVAGDNATVKPNQTCTLALGGAFGNQKITVTSWTLARSGDRIDTNVSSQVPLCTVSGSGVLVRGGLDAASKDAPDDLRSDAADGGAETTDAAPETADAVPEAPEASDAAPETADGPSTWATRSRRRPTERARGPEAGFLWRQYFRQSAGFAGPANLAREGGVRGRA